MSAHAMRVHKTAFRVSDTLVGQEEVSSKTGQKEEASKLTIVHALEMWMILWRRCKARVMA